MKITSVKIKNFRGYKDLTQIKFDDFTVFVGKNDVGKSTILDALDIFFNDSKGAIKIDKTDVNVSAAQLGNDESEITVIFSDLPDKIIIDSTAETSLQEEYMLNAEGELEVVKKYKNGGVTPKIYIKALHPSNPKCSDLLLKKNSELKKILQEEGIECENQSVNVAIRKAIWNNFMTDLQLTEQEIDVSKEDAKKIWDKLSAYLPIYSLFQSDRKNSDGDDEVQDPLKEAVKQILADESIREILTRVAEKVEGKLKEVSNRTLEKLREMDPTIADSLNPVIPTANSLKWQDVFKNVSISGDGNIPINKRGSGVKRLVLLNFFRAEAERQAQSADRTGIIYAIEEPETSQHSNNQRMLIDAFKTIVNNGNSQIILTTHSSYIVKQLEFKNLRLVKENDDKSKEIMEVQPNQLQYPSLNEVNYLAFNEVTEEYHNELYSYIEFQNWLDEYRTGKPQRTYRKLEKGRIVEQKKILSEYIRNQIHHPENHENDRFTRQELKESIESMRDFIQTKKEKGVIEEP